MGKSRYFIFLLDRFAWMIPRSHRTLVSNVALFSTWVSIFILFYLSSFLRRAICPLHLYKFYPLLFSSVGQLSSSSCILPWATITTLLWVDRLSVWLPYFRNKKKLNSIEFCTIKQTGALTVETNSFEWIWVKVPVNVVSAQFRQAILTLKVCVSEFLRIYVKFFSYLSLI